VLRYRESPHRPSHFRVSTLDSLAGVLGEFLANIGWPADTRESVLASAGRDVVHDAAGSHFVVRVAGHPLISATVSERPTVHADLLRRVAANVAYNRHVQTGVLLTPAAGEVLLSRWIAPSSVLDSDESSVDDPILALPFVAGRLDDDLAAMRKMLSLEALLDTQATARYAVAARENGYRIRPTVDRALLSHCLSFRSEVLRADLSAPLSQEERSHFDAMLVTLMTRLLFVRHLEDRHLAGWRRGTLREATASPLDAPRQIAELFAGLQAKFNSELFPAANATAYRMPALDGHTLRAFVAGLYELPKLGVQYDFALLESDSLGLIYQQFAGVKWPGDRPGPQLRLLQKDTISAQSTRDPFGVFYTPPAVVDTVLDLTVRPWMAGVRGSGDRWPRILDLTAGSGVFLSRTFDLLARDVEPLERRDAVALVEHLHGVDIDRRAVALARLNLWMAFARQNADARLPSLADTIRVADSLADDVSETSEKLPSLPDAWRQRGFDIILGNPPFLGHRDAVAHYGADRVRAWHARHRVGALEVNLAALFVERGLRLLRPGGYLGMVIPRNLLKSESGDALRRLLRHACEVVAVVDCLDSALFADADAHAAILVVRRPSSAQSAGSRGIGLVLPDAHRDAFAPLATLQHAAGFSAQRVLVSDLDLAAEYRLLSAATDDVGSEPVWCLLDGTGRCTLERILGPSGTPLKALVTSHYAVDEGLKGAFVLTQVKWRASTVDAYSPALDERVVIERDVMRPAIRPTDIRPLGKESEHPDAAILYPYDESDGTVVSWPQMHRQFPRAATYLGTLEQALRNRRGHGASDGWWVPRAVRSGAPWHTPRPRDRQVILSRHSEWPTAMLARSDSVPVGGGISLGLRPDARLSPGTLLALVSSRLWWWFVMISGSVGERKYYRLRLAVWRNIRVPDALRSPGVLSRDLAAVVTKIGRAREAASVVALWSELDQVVEDAYDLSRTEREALSQVVAVYTQRSREVWLDRRSASPLLEQGQLFG